jgi:hypothetical protein
MNRSTIFCLFIMAAVQLGCSSNPKQTVTNQLEQNIKVGAYFYDGWSSSNRHANDPSQAWAKNAPRMVTRLLVEDFSEREPVWGWRGDSQEIVERQIDLAADHGLDYFLFCWYWRDTNGPINVAEIEKAPHHVSMNYYLKASNKKRLRFGLLVANHSGAEIKGADNWEEAARYWMQYFKDSQYVTVDSKPLVVIFNPSDLDEESISRMQYVAKQHGFKGLSIAGCGAPDKLSNGFTHRTHYNIVPGYRAGSEEHSYSELVEAHQKQWFGLPKMPYIPEVTVGWDKRPWEGPEGNNAPEGYYFLDRTPEQFEAFLRSAIVWMDENPEVTTKERLITLYAWNELGEGGYLVPTKGDPDASYLKIVKKVTSEYSRK